MNRLSILLLVLLAACSPKEEAANSPATPTPAQETPAAEWMITADGVGPIRVGMTVEEARQALAGKLAGAPASQEESCYYVRPDGEPQGVLFMVTDDRIARVDVREGAIATAEGARVGDSEERIQSLYPGRVTVTPHKYVEGHYLTVADGDHRLLFETEAGKVTAYRAGRLPEVEWVEGCS